MTEKNLVINNRTITYKGIFRVQELFTTINKILDQLGYQKQEKKSEEKVTPAGKHTYLELRPFKVKNSYVTLIIKLRINLDNITETKKEVDHVPRTFQQGDLTIAMDAWSLTDFAGRWGMKPWFYFLKAIVNKYIYHLPSEDKFVSELKADTGELTTQLKAFLNLYKYQLTAEDRGEPEITEEPAPPEKP